MSNNTQNDTRFFGHPVGLSTLFFSEMWERFSFYGMRAILFLFMTAAIAKGGLGLKPEEAGPIYAMYTSLVYLVAVPGGWLADNFLGQRKAVLYGGIIIMAGHICLAFHGLVFFYAGLGLVIIGTGLLKPNISTIVGQLYSPQDQRRDSGFSIFYMGINMGAFLAPLICSWLAESDMFRDTLIGWGYNPANSWHWGFGAAAVGMFFGLVQYVAMGKHLGDAGMRPVTPASPEAAAANQKTLRIGIGVVLGLILLIVVIGLTSPALLTKDNIKSAYTVILFTVVFGFFYRLFTANKWSPGERARLTVIVVLFSGAAIFWGVFDQAGSTLTLFAEGSTDNRVFGYEFPAGWWNSVNAALIVLLAPLFSILWIKLGNKNPSYPAKFSIGLVFAGLGFLWLVFGASEFTTGWKEYVSTNKAEIVAQAEKFKVEIKPEKIEVSQVNEIVAKSEKATDTKQLPAWPRVAIYWLLVVYLLHTIGELCLSPVGLSSMTKLAPAQVQGMMMGVWFLASSVGQFLGGTTAGFYEKFELPTLFTLVGASAMLMAAVMFILNKPVKKMLALAEEETKGKASAASGH
jgi:POT family proton-dependent oligopeptide transporter